MKKFKGYTLLEIIMSIIIFSMLVGTIISIYINIKEADKNVAGKRTIISEASDFFDTIHEAAIDYSIDYEEYFNRSGVGNGFTSYGNSGQRYYCVHSNSIQSQLVEGKNYYIHIRDNSNYGCFSGGNQKYLEYNFQHWRLETGYELNDILNSGAYQGDGPIAIKHNTGLHYLYLINNDKTERYYFRWVQKDGDRGVIQALRLVGFDAGSGHDFNSRGAFDGFIDTWACDTAKGFTCSGDNLDGYRLPVGEDDGWINITSDKINVTDFKVDVFPQKDPYLAKNSSDQLMDPYIKISITLGIYGDEEENQLTLSTTLSLKNTYTNF